MNTWIWWALLTYMTGNPLLAFLLVLGGGWAIERVTLGVLPSPFRIFRRYRRASILRNELTLNPHNRKARFELADILIEQRRYREAVEVLKPNIAAGDDDAATLYLMGVACFGAGNSKEGEIFLGEARAQDPGYRLGAIDLALGRGRLAKSDFAGAREALEEYCRQRKGTVEGKVLLAKAREALGDAAGAAALRKEAIEDYSAAPRFIRKQERLWAWRLQPWRPVVVMFVAVMVLLILSSAWRAVAEVTPARLPRHSAGRF